METVPPIALQDVLFFKCDLNLHFIDVVNVVLLMGKYHIHSCKWKKNVSPPLIYFYSILLKSFKILQKT